MKRRATFQDTQVGASLNLTLVTCKDGGPVEILTLPLLPLTWLLSLAWWLVTQGVRFGRVVEAVVLWPGGLIQQTLGQYRVRAQGVRVWGVAWAWGVLGVEL